MYKITLGTRLYYPIAILTYLNIPNRYSMFYNTKKNMSIFLFNRLFE